MSEMPRNFDMRGNPSANPNLTSGRVEGYYEMGFPTVWAIQDMLANIRELNATVDQLKAAQSAPAPKVLYEGEPVLSLAKDNIQLAIEAIEDIRRQYLEVLRLDRCRTIQPGTNIINRLADAQKYLEELAEENKEQP